MLHKSKIFVCGIGIFIRANTFPNRPLRIMLICPQVHTGYLAKNPAPI